MNVLKIIEQMKADFRAETGKEATDIYVGKSGMETILHEVQANRVLLIEKKEDATSQLCGLTLHKTEDESCLGIGISVDHLKEKAMSNKEWKPATSPADLAMRLENGELFNDGGNKVWYDPSESNPYRYGYEALLDGWSLFAEMTQWIEQPEWTKQLDKVNVWCQVSDMSKEHALSEHLATPIEKYDAGSDYPYRDKAGRRWKFAIPIENLTGPK